MDFKEYSVIPFSILFFFWLRISLIIYSFMLFYGIALSSGDLISLKCMTTPLLPSISYSSFFFFKKKVFRFHKSIRQKMCPKRKRKNERNEDSQSPRYSRKYFHRDCFVS